MYIGYIIKKISKCMTKQNKYTYNIYVKTDGFFKVTHDYVRNRFEGSTPMTKN